jgi:hypothetical protein
VPFVSSPRIPDIRTPCVQILSQLLERVQEVETPRGGVQAQGARQRPAADAHALEQGGRLVCRQMRENVCAEENIYLNYCLRRKLLFTVCRQMRENVCAGDGGVQEDGERRPWSQDCRKPRLSKRGQRAGDPAVFLSARHTVARSIYHTGTDKDKDKDKDTGTGTGTCTGTGTDTDRQTHQDT